MHIPRNEGKACDAVVRWLEERTGNTRADVCVPEKCQTGPPVELRLFLGPQEFALEHTLIEPFSGFIKTGISLEEIVRPIKNAVAGKLPGPAHYQLLLPTDPHMNKSDIQSFSGVVIDLVLEYAPTLYEKALESTYPGEWVVTVPTSIGLPYSLELSCRIIPDHTNVKEAGVFGIVRRTPDDLGKKRKDRLRKALYEKCRKLNNCNGARTVLVLEDNDIALTSPVDVCQKLRSIFAEEYYQIDEIILVDTTSWTLWPIKCDLDWPPIDFTMLDPANLSEITSLKCPRHQLSPCP